MVVSMIIMICIMVIDRVFYSAQQISNSREVAKKLDTDAPLAAPKSSSSPSVGAQDE
jgi:hypothetical protein